MSDPAEPAEPSEDASPADGWLPDGFSDDQRAAALRVAEAVAAAGVDLAALTAEQPDGEASSVMAVLGKAGSGKTHLLAWLVERLIASGAKQVVQDWEARRAKAKARVSFAVVAPTNKAASVLRTRGVGATTLHRIIYTPVYDPDYESLAQWVADPKQHPKPTDVAGVTETMLERARAVFEQTKSVPAALATIGLRGSEFITGWKRREDRISIALVDEASMLDAEQLSDLREIFDVVCLFGDPAQLPPVGGGGKMVFEDLPERALRRLSRVHRQAADNPILDLAYALQQDIGFSEFEQRLREAAARDDRIEVAARVDADLMARAPVLVWRNATRIRLIHAFRAAHGLSETELAPGEPLICDGLELPAKKRNLRIDLEQAGLVKGAQAFWRGPGKKPGQAALYVPGAPKPKFGASAIIQIERPDAEEPLILTAARQGAVFVHGAACTIHKAQGSQWPTVQVFAPDLFAAARSGREEAGAPLWRRLAYVAITRAEERLIWATRYALARPKEALTAEDLEAGPLV
ncbi:MAG: AAA family ATPase [Pseudomonadota bacterium]